MLGRRLLWIPFVNISYVQGLPASPTMLLNPRWTSALVFFWLLWISFLKLIYFLYFFCPSSSVPSLWSHVSPYTCCCFSSSISSFVPSLWFHVSPCCCFSSSFLCDCFLTLVSHLLLCQLYLRASACFLSGGLQHWLTTSFQFLFLSLLSGSSHSLNLLTRELGGLWKLWIIQPKMILAVEVWMKHYIVQN